MTQDIEARHDNALSLLRGLGDQSVDLLIADPPYNLGKDYGNNSDSRAFDDYLYFSEEWVEEAVRTLKPHGSIFVFMGVRFISYLYQILEQKNKLEFNSWIVWHYTQGMGKTKGFSPRHDDILFFSKSKDFRFNLDPVRVPQKFYRSRNNMRGANPGDVWEFSHVHYCNSNRQKHPTQKPEGLLERMILCASREADLVVDPFMGSGTTLRVCQQLNRKCIGADINEEYVEMVKERLDSDFSGFDSIDPRMKRVPNDLRRPEIRDAYLENHSEWFLKNHENDLKDFEKEVFIKYGVKRKKKSSDNDDAQASLFG